MPKFKSVLVKEEKVNKEGKIVQNGEIVLIPLDDAAMLEPCCDKALSMGMINDEKGVPYTPEKFEAKRVELRAAYKKKQQEDLKRRQQY
jgi:hypothetical protein